MAALYKILPGFLGEEVRKGLLEYVMANQYRFEPTTIGDALEQKNNVRIRVSSKLVDLGKFKKIIEEKVLGLLPSLVAELGMMPFDPCGVEIEVVAHGDGAFYKRHIDVFTGTERKALGEDRFLTLVYYFHNQTKAFEGGALRVYPLPGMAIDQVNDVHDIQPNQDTAVAFSSWLPHEVLEVSCPANKFENSRFAVNCWVLRKQGIQQK